MNTKQDELCVDVLAAIAWADGQVSEAEMERTMDLIERMEYVDRPRIQEILFVPHNAPSVSRLETLERKTRVRLLHDAYLLAEYCEGVGEEERAVVRTIASTIVPEDRWPEVHRCLKAYVDYERSAEALWGVTHIG